MAEKPSTDKYAIRKQGQRQKRCVSLLLLTFSLDRKIALGFPKAKAFCLLILRFVFEIMFLQSLIGLFRKVVLDLAGILVGGIFIDT